MNLIIQTQFYGTDPKVTMSLELKLLQTANPPDFISKKQRQLPLPKLYKRTWHTQYLKVPSKYNALMWIHILGPYMNLTSGFIKLSPKQYSNMKFLTKTFSQIYSFSLDDNDKQMHQKSAYKQITKILEFLFFNKFDFTINIIKFKFAKLILVYFTNSSCQYGIKQFILSFAKINLVLLIDYF
ncbi:unnamed protein product [Paramecium pentaurelia]|uniref:Uncharacterized protein n=1 Tax=Paramecium pentaurelia TaxID=43138 RepID=A0A8S1VB98_9CILI|nr:unnamed protein product [Paramecium pentaurelia]